MENIVDIEINDSDNEKDKSIVKIKKNEKINIVKKYKEHSMLFGALVDNPLLSDLEITIKNKDGNNRKIYAHKAILASHSEPFKAMFTSGMKEAITNKLIINDIKPDTFMSVLNFIYTGEIKLSISSK